MTIGFLAMGAAGFGWGALSDRIGPRYVVLAGAVLLGLGLFLASRAQSALAIPARVSACWSASPSAASHSDDRRGDGMVTEHRASRCRWFRSGSAVAPMTMSPFAAWLVTQMDWRGAQVVLAVLVWATLVPAALFVRRPPSAPQRSRARPKDRR